MAKLTSGNVTTRIFQFAWPMLLGNVFQQLYIIVDGIIVGKYVGKEALAGVLASSQVIMVLISLIIGVGIGGTVVVAQHFGARNYDKVKQTSDTITLFMLIASIIFGVVGIIFSSHILHLMQIPPESFHHAKAFLNVYFAGMITMFGYNAIASILRGIGDSRTPLYALMVAMIINIGLDFLFVLGLKMGTAGAALATVVAQGVSWLFIILYVRGKSNLLTLNFFKAKFDTLIFKQSLRIGLPSGLQQTFVAIGMAALFGIINTFGVDVAAGYGAATRIDMFISLPAMNFAAALSTFAGQNIGAGNFERAKKGLKSTLIMSGAVCVALTLIVIPFRHSIITLFTDASNTEVIKVGAQYLTIVCSFYILFSSMFVINGLLRGAGASLMPMVSSLLALWVIRIPVAYFLSRSEHLGYIGTFWAIPIAWCVGLTLALSYYLSGRWKNKAVIKHPQPVMAEAESSAEASI